MSGEAVGGVADWIVGLMLTLGYFGVAALVFLDNVFPPIPSEVILPLAGFVAQQGYLALPGVIVAATVGSVAGALPLYGLGYWLGEAPLRRFIRRFGRVLFLKEADLDQAQDWFDRHGAKAVLLGRCAPLVRSLVSIPAGLARMPLWRFVIYTGLGSALWNTLLICLGFALGESWHILGPYLRSLQNVLLVALGLGLVWFLWRRRSTFWRRSTPAD